MHNLRLVALHGHGVVAQDGRDLAPREDSFDHVVVHLRDSTQACVQVGVRGHRLLGLRCRGRCRGNRVARASATVLRAQHDGTSARCRRTAAELCVHGSAAEGSTPAHGLALRAELKDAGRRRRRGTSWCRVNDCGEGQARHCNSAAAEAVRLLPSEDSCSQSTTGASAAVRGPERNPCAQI